MKLIEHVIEEIRCLRAHDKTRTCVSELTSRQECVPQSLCQDKNVCLRARAKIRMCVAQLVPRQEHVPQSLCQDKDVSELMPMCGSALGHLPFSRCCRGENGCQGGVERNWLPV